jgi:hypothetical protein
MATDPVSADLAPPVTYASTQAQEMLSSLGQDHRIEGERYRSLLSQAERIRLCLLTIARLRRRMTRNGQNGETIAILNRFSEVAGDLLYSIGLSLTANENLEMARSDLKRITTMADELRQIRRDNLSSFPRALLDDAQIGRSRPEGDGESRGESPHCGDHDRNYVIAANQSSNHNGGGGEQTGGKHTACPLRVGIFAVGKRDVERPRGNAHSAERGA